MTRIISIAEAEKIYLEEMNSIILPDHIIAQINTKMVKCIGELKNETKDESYQEPSLDIFLVGEDTNQKYIDCIKYSLSKEWYVTSEKLNKDPLNQNENTYQLFFRVKRDKRN